jgi:hypothetical protein
MLQTKTNRSENKFYNNFGIKKKLAFSFDISITNIEHTSFNKENML